MKQKDKNQVCRVRDVVSLIDEIAPYELAQEWDNVGLLLGKKEAEVRKILVALDITDAVVDQAEKVGCQVIVTHHPFMFKPIKRLTDETREGRLMLRMAAAGIAHIAAHTNLDAAEGGVNDCLIRVVGAENIRGEGCLRVGDIPAMYFDKLCRQVELRLNAQIRAYGDPRRMVHVLGCCSGSGSEEYREAMKLGADCFLTGEVRHNVALDALSDGCLMIEAGHYETEKIICPVLCESLQKRMDELKFDVSVYCSSKNLMERE